MQAINIRQLKHNPSAALRSAKEDDFVVIMNRDEPQALLIDLKRLGVPDVNRVRVALAVALFKQNTISLGYAARIADKTLQIGTPSAADRFEALRGTRCEPCASCVGCRLVQTEHDLSRLCGANSR